VTAACPPSSLRFRCWRHLTADDAGALGGVHASSHPALELSEDLLILGEVPRLQLRVDELAVYCHFKAAVFSRDEFQSAEPFAERIHDRFRQAHGLWDVVSSHAIFNGDFLTVLCHSTPPLVMSYSCHDHGCRYRSYRIVNRISAPYLLPIASNVKRHPAARAGRWAAYPAASAPSQSVNIPFLSPKLVNMSKIT
jgi:hypothetical protein